MKALQLFGDYEPLDGVYDEYFLKKGCLRPHIEETCELFAERGWNQLLERQNTAEELFRQQGVTFNVYQHSCGVEKIFPFDSLPRILSSQEWNTIEKGLIQRVQALNAFLCDIYTEQKILKDHVIPQEVVLSSPGYKPQLLGITPPGGTYIHIAGIDLVRQPDGEFLVLEDNLKVPSGVSYVLQNRLMMKNLYPYLFEDHPIKNVSAYPIKLASGLAGLAGKEKKETLGVLLTPGPYNAAYYEHLFLAKQLGYDLVTGQDLYVENSHVFLKTIEGPKKVDVIYRRVDDEYMDPNFFYKDSLLGVPGIMDAYQKGTVVIANAFGNGIADDKAIYVYVPEMIRYYLSEEPILKQVKTYQCMNKNDLNFVLDHMTDLVIKKVDASGGYQMLFGPQSTASERDATLQNLMANPRCYIAQPVVEISACPTLENNSITPKRVDLRPYIVTGKSSWVLPGGLTRVALKEGSYVVNSSQGGGSKDTWVLEQLS